MANRIENLFKQLSKEQLLELNGISQAFKSDGLRPATINNYIRMLIRVGVSILDDVDKVNDRLESVEFTSKGSRALAISSIRSYYRVSRQKDKMNEIENIKYRSGEKTLTITSLEILRLIDACKNEDERMIVKILLGTGIRRGVLLHIKPKDVKGNYIQVRKDYVGNKAGKDYKAPMNNRLKGRLLEYIENKGIPEDKPIFGDLFDGNFPEAQLTGLVVDIGKRCDVEVTPHVLRHTFGTAFYKATKDPYKTMKALGQWDLKSTQRYINIVETLDEDVLDEVDKKLFGDQIPNS